jgi:hypothetical protein
MHLIKDFSSDLASPSLACRAFLVVALELMHSRKRFVQDKQRIEPYICGLQLRSIVGLEMCSINHLILILNNVGKEYIELIARVVAPTFSTLLKVEGKILQNWKSYSGSLMGFETYE